MRGPIVKHEEALETMAAERYVLGELHDHELEQFEEHFFSCPECAQDVRDLSTLTAGAKVVLKRPRKPEPPKLRAAAPADQWRWPWLRLGPSLAWASALVLVTGFSVYQTAQLRTAMRPQAVPAILLKPETRGEAAVISIDYTEPFAPPLAVDLPGAAGRLAWDIRQTGSEKVVYQDTTDTPPRGKMFEVRVPSSMLPPGEYTLNVHSGATAPGKSWFAKFKLVPSGR